MRQDTEISNTVHCRARPGDGRAGRPIGGLSEARNSREIKEMVPLARIERATPLRETDFESVASTSSATGAMDETGQPAGFRGRFRLCSKVSYRAKP